MALLKAESSWAKEWLHLLEDGDPARMSRGRTYARKKNVLEFYVDDFTIHAKVQGSRRKPYNVTITIERFTEEDWNRASELLSPTLIDTMRSHILPREINNLFDEPLVPESNYDVESDCSCHDWARPCKHIAAVYYIFAEYLDLNPFLLLDMRGMHLMSFIRRAEELSTEKIKDLPLEAFWATPSNNDKPTATRSKTDQYKRISPFPWKLEGKKLHALLKPGYETIKELATKHYKKLLEKIKN